MRPEGGDVAAFLAKQKELHLGAGVIGVAEPRQLGQRLQGAVAHVHTRAGRIERERVVDTAEQIAGDVREVPPVPQPRPRR